MLSVVLRRRSIVVSLASLAIGLCIPLGIVGEDSPATAPAGVSGRDATPGRVAANSPMVRLPITTMLACEGHYANATDRQPGTINSLLALAQSARQLGLLPEKGRLYADVASCLPLLSRYPHALGLLDVSCRSRSPGSYKLDELRAVLLLRTGDDVEPVLQSIQQLILSYTNDRVTDIREVSTDFGSDDADRDSAFRYHRLTDSRLPGWAICEWGRLGDLYVVAFGDGAWEQAARAILGLEPSLGDDPWFRRAYADCHGPEASFAVMTDLHRIEERLGEVAGDVPRQVIEALDWTDCRRNLWTIGQSGRAVTCYSATLVRGEYQFKVISDPAGNRADLLAVVPAQADRYAIARMHLGRWLPKVVRGYVSARNERVQPTMTRWWREYQRQAGVNVRHELLGQLGGEFVFHTYPRHPLGLPFLGTMLFEIRGDADRVRRALEKLWAGPEPTASQPTSQPTQRPFFLRAKRTADGIWYWQAGVFVVLGLGVQEDWVVISFSPEAVRRNIEHLDRIRDRKTDTRPAGDDAGQPRVETVPPVP